MRKNIRKRVIVTRAGQTMFEMLEGRRMLSASLNHHGVLNVNGTGNDDVIVVSMDDSKPDTVDVSINGTTTQFDAKSINSVKVNSRGGKDDVSVASTVTTPATVNGGGGDDSLTAGGGDDSLNGGGGDDSLEGGSGSCTMIGGGGDDRMFGGSGNASMDGGGGDDSITGGDGVETLHGGGGDDTIINGTGESHIDGGKGRDHINFNPTAGVAFPTLPAVVQTGLTTLAQGATIDKVIVFQTNGQTYYGTLVTINNVPTRIVVDSNGNPVTQGDKGQGESGPKDKGGFGTVTAVDTTAGTITVNVFSEHKAATKTTFKVNSSTTITANGTTITLADLKAGAIVNVKTLSSDPTTATEITAVNQRVFGSVAAVDTAANTITVTLSDTSTKTYTVNPNAKVEVNGVDSNLASITTNKIVQLEISASDGTAVRVEQVDSSSNSGGGGDDLNTEVHGTVASIDTAASTVTVTDASSTNTTYTVTTGTSIFVNGHPGALADLAAGSEIELKIAADGATVISLNAHAEDNHPGPVTPPIGVPVVGEISAVSSTSISVDGKHGLHTSFTIDSSTKVTLDGATSDVSSLKVGQDVFIVASSDGSTAITINAQTHH